MVQWEISAGPGVTCSSAVALGRVAALPSLQESLLCVGLAAWDSGNSTGGQGWCLDPMVGKCVLCQRSGQPSASAEQRNKTHCGKETRMLKMFCIILSGDVYCKYMWLLHTAFGTDRFFFFFSMLIVDKNPETLTQPQSYPEILKISHVWQDETKALMYQGCLNTSRVAIPWVMASHRPTCPQSPLSLCTVPASRVWRSPGGKNLNMEITSACPWPWAPAVPPSPWALRSPWVAGLEQQTLLSSRTHACRPVTMNGHWEALEANLRILQDRICVSRCHLPDLSLASWLASQLLLQFQLLHKAVHSSLRADTGQSLYGGEDRSAKPTRDQESQKKLKSYPCWQAARAQGSFSPVHRGQLLHCLCRPVSSIRPGTPANPTLGLSAWQRMLAPKERTHVSFHRFFLAMWLGTSM